MQATQRTVLEPLGPAAGTPPGLLFWLSVRHNDLEQVTYTGGATGASGRKVNGAMKGSRMG